MLAIDLGSRRVGLALSDELRLAAQPLRVIDAEPAETLVKRLVEISREVGAVEVVVGLPRRLDGSEGAEAKQSRAVAHQLRTQSKLPVALIDERLSTAQAERSLISAGRRRAQRRASVDAVAAALLLQDYLGRKSGS